ncbi:cupin domain-containing protein [Gallaecimonas kandeliae]|uniref:cupin domain-containing protein n=1 Tax=Gallaecimonas kandeliae TaxID=3029055 RepID=UPI002649E04C|nr:cupin domain-containing protein [Gallaecimonas kandeliae]WKE64770.1 cupin domain-containing protein [Gallaecimonas kandeliae]
MKAQNLLNPLPDAFEGEVFDDLLSRPGLRLERIVSHGQGSPEGFWYEQQQHEWVLVLEGEAELGFEGGEAVHLAKGCCQLLPAGVKHRVNWTAPDRPTVWLALFFDP